MLLLWLLRGCCRCCCCPWRAGEEACDGLLPFSPCLGLGLSLGPEAWRHACLRWQEGGWGSGGGVGGRRRGGGGGTIAATHQQASAPFLRVCSHLQTLRDALHPAPPVFSSDHATIAPPRGPSRLLRGISVTGSRADCAGWAPCAINFKTRQAGGQGACWAPRSPPLPDGRLRDQLDYLTGAHLPAGVPSSSIHPDHPNHPPNATNRLQQHTQHNISALPPG